MKPLFGPKESQVHRDMKIKFLPFCISEIIDFAPSKLVVLVRSHKLIDNKWWFYHYELTKVEFDRLVFEYRKYLKTKDDPEQRIADFEWIEDNIYSLEKFKRVYNSRLRANERHLAFAL